MVHEVVHGATIRCYASRPRSIVEVLERALDDHGDDVLLIDPALQRTLSYDDFARLVEGAAASLLARGLAPGDRVALIARNGLESAVAIWACARAGLIHVGLPADAPADRLAELLTLTTPALLLAQPEFAPACRAAVSAAGGPPAIDAAAALLSAEKRWDAGTPLPDQDTTYSLIPTSGTTGRPKAVRVTGRMTGHAAAFYVRTLGLLPSDRTAIHLPFAWVSGHVTQLTPAMLSGGSAVTMSGFTGPGLVDTVTQHAVTWLDVVPSIWEVLLRTRSFALPGLRGLRLAVFGGSGAPPGTLDRVRDRLPQLRLYDVYAMSETCAPITCLLDGESLRKAGTVGRAAPYADLRLVEGELQVRSPAVTPGYWGEPPSPSTPDGWLRTGDLGTLDEEGYLTVGGRAVDLIIRGGVNIYPAEVEQILIADVTVADAAVAGLPSPVTGHNVAAVVVAAPGAAVDTAALQDQVRRRVGRHAVPRPIRVVDAVPRNRNGKVDRTAVRDLLS